MSEQQQGFWSSIPGILTGLAAVITAVAGLIVAMTGGAPETIKNMTLDENTEIPIVYGEVIEEEPVTVEETSLEPTAITLNALVDCKLFTTQNTVTSLLGWSDYYHKQIINAGASKDACNKAIAYRAQAHCKDRNNLTIRQGLAETLSHCKAIKFSWKDVQL